MVDEDGQEQERALAERQADGVYPIGRALRATYGADNHDSLGPDLTGLMLALARIDPPPAAPASPAPPVPVAAAAPPRASWWARLFGGAGRPA